MSRSRVTAAGGFGGTSSAYDTMGRLVVVTLILVSVSLLGQLLRFCVLSPVGRDQWRG